MKKHFKYYLVMWVVYLALINALAFVSVEWLAKGNYASSFWIRYVAITVEFLCQAFCSYIAFKDDGTKKLFYNLPLVRVSHIGLTVSFVIGAICAFIPAFPYWLCILLCAIVLAANVSAVAKARAAAGAVEEIDVKVKTQTQFIKLLTVDAGTLLEKAGSEEIKKECRAVYEAVRYSDPMSVDGLAEEETDVLSKFSVLAGAVNEGNAETVSLAAKDVLVALKARNEKLRALK